MDIKQAIKFMIISALAFTLMNLIVKYLSNVSAFQIVFFRSASSLFFTIGFLLKHKIPLLGNNKKLLILRGLTGVISMIFFFMSIKYLPIGTAVTLRYISPIFAAIFAVIVLREYIKPVQWLFFLMAFSGVVLLKGLDNQISGYGLFLALIAAFFSGLVYIIINKIGKSEHPVIVVNYFMVIATLVGGVLSIRNWVNPVGIDWLLLLSLGVVGYFGQLYMTKAFQVASTNQVAPLKYIEVIFSVLFGLIWFDEIYTLWSLLGILMIIIGLIFNVRYKTKCK